MKKRFLDYSLKLITNNNPNLSSEKKDELRYGLEGFYLTITKAIFIFLPFISRYIVFPLYLKYILGCISIILIALYAPADTIKHPLINKNKRIVLKMLSITFCIMLVVLSIIIKNETIDSLIIFGIYVEISLIIPITYKLFHLSYNNYKNYILKNNLS